MPENGQKTRHNRREVKAINSYIVSIFTSVGICILPVLGLLLITGMTGMFTLAQGAMVCVGAYISAIVSTRLGFPIPLSIITATIGTALVASILGMAVLKLKQHYFALATFLFAQFINGVLTLTSSLTGGASGYVGVPIGVKFGTVWTAVLAAIVLVAYLKSTGFGRKCYAVRDDALAAEALGVNIYLHKVIVYALGSAFAGLAGALYVHYMSCIDPTTFNWMKSAEWLIIVFFGGRSSLTGTLISASILLVLPEALRSAQELRTIIYCVLILLVLSFKPTGMLGDSELPFGKWFKAIADLICAPFKKGGGDNA